MISVIAKVFGGKPFLVLLIATVAGLGVLLVNSYKANGVLSNEVAAWQQANNQLTNHIEKLNKSVIERDGRLRELSATTSESIRQIIEVKDETNCIDVAMPDDLRVQFQGANQNLSESADPVD